MLLTRSERKSLVWLAAAAAAWVAGPLQLTAEPLGGQGPARAGLAAPAAPAAPQQAQAPSAQTRGLVSSQIMVSPSDATLQLSFMDGRQVEFAIRDGRMFADGADVGAAPQNGAGSRAWRELLARAGTANTAELEKLLRGWVPPAEDMPLKQGILGALSGALPAANAAPAAPGAPAPGVAVAPPGLGPNSDTLAKLENRLEQMQEKLTELQEHREARNEREGWGGPFRYIWRGLSGLLATLVIYAILFAVGLATVFFGGRPYLEAVADTARRQTARSWLVGLAASFLVVPAFVLGVLALTISIVGIPALLVFVPLFPVAVIVAALFGYLAVAHGAGEALAERRLYGGDWFRRGNSYYFLMSGLGVLLALFLAEQVVSMAGPWLGFIRGLLTFLAVVLTWFAFTTGFGAVLLTRGGTRPTTGMGPLDSEPSLGFEEESRV